MKYSRKEHRRLYRIYHSMKRRCYKETETRYKNYGGRGICICDEWLDTVDGFDRFADWAYTHGYSDELTIERIDVNSNYCPENCKWIPLSEQGKNKSTTIWVDYHGERVSLRDICNQKGLNYNTIHHRITRGGWNAERAIDEPIKTGETLADRSRAHGLLPGTVNARVKKFGWSEEEALNTPTIGRGANYTTYGRY